MSNLKKMDNALVSAKTIKDALQLNFAKEMVVRNYQAFSGKKDGDAYFASLVFSMLSVINEKPELKDCDRFSVIGAMVQIAQWDLSIDDGHIDLIKYGNILKAGRNYKGKREQLRKMPTIKSVDEGVLVLKGEKFVWDKANNKVLEHISGEDIPVKSIDDIRYAYVKVTFNDNTYVNIVVTNEELKKAKSKSKNKSENSVWEQWPGQMCKKVPVHRAWTIYYRKPAVSVEWDLKEFNKDEDDVPIETINVPHQETPSEQPPQEVVQEAKVMDEKKDIDTFLNS